MTSKVKRRQLNNKGFSLVELIVIMVIVVLLSTAVVASFVNSSSQKVKASSKLVTEYLADALNYTMTKGDAAFTISCDNKGVYTVEDGQGHKKNLDSGISISYDFSDETTKTDVTESKPLVISFSRVNGSFKPIDVTGEDGTTAEQYVKHINITADKEGKSIHLYTKTGEFEIEDYETHHKTTE